MTRPPEAARGPTLGRLERDPAFHLHQLDMDARHATFVSMTPEDYAELPFHDWRAEAAPERLVVTGLDPLLRRAAAPGSTFEPRLHFIFHTAFSCSTLLSTCLGALGSCFALREPTLLTVLIRELLIESRDAKSLSRLAAVLLGRTWSDRQTAVVKANDVGNLCMAPILGLSAASRALFLFNSCRAAMLCYLKRADWTLARAQTAQSFLRGHGVLPVAMEEVDLDALSASRVAGHLWLSYVYLYLDLVAGPQWVKIRSLDCSDFLERPVETLRQLCSHFGLAATTEEIQLVVGGDVLRRRAKAPLLEYSPAQRAADLEQVYRRHQSEVDEALAWVEELSRERPIPTPLPQPLDEV
jgi:hypothetical protein